MAISANMVWQIQQSGDDTFGGGFRGGCELSTPSAPTVNATSGGSVAVATYFVVVAVTTGNGETSKSAETAVTTTSSNKTITVNHPTDPSVQGSSWAVYFGTTSGGPYFAGTSGTGLLFTTNYTITVTPPTTGTNPPGTDRSLGTSAQVVIENSAITCTTTGANSNTLTFTLGYTPTAADVGNVVHLTGGTNIRVGWYEITGWTSTTWTLTGNGNATTAGGAGSAVTGKMGGALATPGGFGAVDASDGTINQTCYALYNASAYTCGSTANVAAGRYSGTHGTQIVGYATTRTKDNTDASRPTFDAGAASMTVITTTGNQGYLRNVIVTNSAARASVVGFNTQGTVEFCKADSCVTGFTISGSGNPGITADCLANACGTGFNSAANSVLERCVSLGHTSGGFTGGATVHYIECVAKGGTATGFLDGHFVNCVSRDNSGGTSIGFASSGVIRAVNCIAWNNGQYNYQTDASAAGNYFQARIVNCAGGGAGTSNFNPSSVSAAPTQLGVQAIMVKNFVSLGVDPHTNASGGDLSLNTAATGGALCRAAGIPGTLPGLSTTGYRDQGVAQHADPSTGAGPVIGCAFIRGTGVAA